MKLKLDREEGRRFGSAEKARKVILEKRKRKVKEGISRTKRKKK